MDKIRILCYGDSNTWGYISGTDHQRYMDDRWTRQLAKLLGDGFEIIEEGLNSRTLLSEDPRPGKVGRNGYNYLIPCLETHDPVDLVVIMLGTNELKYGYNRTAEEIGELFEEYFVKTIINKKSQIDDRYPKLLIVAPPLVNENAEYSRKDDKYRGAAPKSAQLSGVYRSIAEKYNCAFVDNDGLTTGPDGVHLDKQSHRLLAESIAAKIKEIYS